MFSIKSDSWLTFAVCSITGAAVFIETAGYPVLKGQGFGQGPGFYPRLLAGTMICLGLLTLLQDWLHRRDGSDGQGTESVPTHLMKYRSVLFLMLLAIFSTMAMNSLGFLVSGFALTFLSVLVIRSPLKGRHVATGLLYSLGLMALVYVVFGVLVGVQLPPSSFLR